MRSTGRLVLLALAVSLMASAVHAANLAPVQIFEDPAKDNATAAQATPDGQDLRAGFISETDDAIKVTWQVTDLPDVVPSPVPGVPEVFIYYFEFSLSAPDGSEGSFSLRARYAPAEVTATAGVPDAGVSQSVAHTSGALQHNCSTNAANVVSCSAVPGAVVKITWDGAANTVTASMRRVDLLAANGAPLAVDGATLDEADLFGGIQACTSFVAVTSGSMCDSADMDDTYVLGSPRA